MMRIFNTGSVKYNLLLGGEIGHDSYNNQNYYRNGTCNGIAMNPATGTSGDAACVPLIDPSYDDSPSSAPQRAGNLATGINNTDITHVPGYVRLDATAAWKQSKYEVRLNVFKLTDKFYYDALIPSDGGRAVPGTGITGMLSFTYRM